MTELEFLQAVRQMAEENGIDFFAAVEGHAEWSLHRDKCPLLNALAVSVRAVPDALSGAGVSV